MKIIILQGVKFFRIKLLDGASINTLQYNLTSFTHFFYK